MPPLIMFPPTTSSDPPPTLLDLLLNPILTAHILPRLSAHDRLRLSATCRFAREHLVGNPIFFRHVDLTSVRNINFKVRKEPQLDEMTPLEQAMRCATEDEFFSGPMRGTLSSLRRLLPPRTINTLILDTIPISSSILHDLLTDPHVSPLLLSLRGTPSNDTLWPSVIRDAYTASLTLPRVQTLYLFGTSESRKETTTLGQKSPSESTRWYRTRGEILPRQPAPHWAALVADMHGKLTFDAVLCTGPAHASSPIHHRYQYDMPSAASAPAHALARYSLGRCASCHSAPEGLTYCDPHYAVPGSLPALSPVPLLEHSVRAATTPWLANGGGASGTEDKNGRVEDLFFVPRCEGCVRGRMCRGCFKWFCEDCLPVDGVSRAASPVPSVETSSVSSSGEGLEGENVSVMEVPASQSPPASPCPTNKNQPAPIVRECLECGYNCLDCYAQTHSPCLVCTRPFCRLHETGSKPSICDRIHPRITTTLTGPPPATGTTALGLINASGHESGGHGRHTEAWRIWMEGQRLRERRQVVRLRGGR